MKKSYELVCDLVPLAEEIGATLKEHHNSAIMVDRSTFVGPGSCCRIDTYQVFELTWNGYITINVCFFRPELASDQLMVQVSAFSPRFNNTSMKIKKIYREIEAVITAHTAPASQEP